MVSQRKNAQKIAIIILVKFRRGTITNQGQKSYMDFSVHKDFSELSPESWNALVEQSITDTPFSRYEYLSEWWQTLGGGEWKDAELVLVSAVENDQLVGIAPLFITDYEGQRALMLVGSIEISDYLDWIVRDQDLPGFLSGLLVFLLSSFAASWS